MTTDKSSALKEEIMEIVDAHSLDTYDKVIDVAIRKTQEADNLSMKKDATIIHNQRIQLLELQSKIKELETKPNCKKHNLGMFWCPDCAREEVTKTKSETIRKVEEIVKRECVMDAKPMDDYERGVHKTGVILLKHLKRL